MLQNQNFLLKNIGFSDNFFEQLEREPSTYVIKKERLRKVVSDSAVDKIQGDFLETKRARDDHYIDAYRDVEVDQENPFGDDTFEGETSRFIKESSYIDENTMLHAELQEEEEVEKDENLEIFKNCSKNQMAQLSNIVNKINKTNEEKVMVKAYKSKLKAKFYKIYEENSNLFKEKVKYKMFHKCNFPSCGRTFASAGWLKSHFSEHLSDIRKAEFNVQFENLVKKSKSTPIRNYV